MSLAPRLVIGLTIAGIAVGVKYYHKGQDDKDVLKVAHMIVASCDQYRANSANQAYMDGLCDRFHPDAFDHAYHIGDKRKAAWMNNKQYFDELLDAMARQAKADGSTHIAADLLKTKEALDKGAAEDADDQSK